MTVETFETAHEVRLRASLTPDGLRELADAIEETEGDLYDVSTTGEIIRVCVSKPAVNQWVAE